MRRPDTSALWLLLGVLATALAGFDLIKQLRAPPEVEKLAEHTVGERLVDDDPPPDFRDISFVALPNAPPELQDRRARENPPPPNRETPHEPRRYVGTIRVNDGSSTVYVRRQ